MFCYHQKIMLQCSSHLFRPCGSFVVYDYDQVSALATVDSHRNYCTDSKHESPEDTATVDLTSDWLQTKEKNKNRVALSWYLNKLMTDDECRTQSSHLVDTEWNTVFQASTIQQAVFSCRAHAHTHTHTLTAETHHLHNKIYIPVSYCQL